MSTWINKFTCPDFLFCPCKPHTKGEKYHIPCFGESGIMHIWDIVEGNYYTTQMGRPKFDININMRTVCVALILNRVLWNACNMEINCNGHHIMCSERNPVSNE